MIPVADRSVQHCFQDCLPSNYALAIYHSLANP
ncbi:MAG: hypothetical protein QOH35_4223 [Acidobacteriaceae bacterium]|nr:hypothetical protein [Acidobacteriaceae bacterium]